MYSDNQCATYGGIQNGNVCCLACCGSCGGVGCGKRPGGTSNCCTKQIPENQICGTLGRKAPCHLKNGKSILWKFNPTVHNSNSKKKIIYRNVEVI